MLNFLWWFAVGPAVGWLTGKLMRTTAGGLLAAISGLVGAFLVGTVCDLLDFELSSSGPGSILIGMVGAFLSTLVFCKAIAKDSQAPSRAANGRSSSFTSYKSRMRK
jgi:uncharacterized membrane protein YeaQ/YmgE (transglycosylase-associated protein family)